MFDAGGGIKVELKDFQPIHEKCKTCTCVIEEEELNFKRCKAYINPTYWWTNGRSCPLATTEMVSMQDVVKKAIKEGIISEDKGMFIYANHRINSIKHIMSLLRQNRGLYADLKRKLGIVDPAEEIKKRIGQQKQKKYGRYSN